MMRGLIRPTSAAAFCLASLLIGSGIQAQNADRPGRTRSTVERMTLERLAAAHADVQAIQALLDDSSNRSGYEGLNDYKGVFHAHAGDSAHTGGTLDEMLADARRAGVDVIFLSDHFRPPRDFMDSGRGVTGGVLLIPGSETSGFLVSPAGSIMETMSASKEEIIAAVTKGDGLIFLSHVEERTDHPMDGLTGMEIYNRHADAKDDQASMFALAAMVTDPEQLPNLRKAVELYPDEILASQLDYPTIYMNKWDAETQSRRLVGVAANDCHHNQVFVLKKVNETTALLGTIIDDDDEMRKVTAESRPGLPEILKGVEVGEFAASLDFDPYYRSFFNVSTHIFAQELTEQIIRAAVKAGHCYVSHDWMADPKGFAFWGVEGRLTQKQAEARTGLIPTDQGPDDRPAATMGDEMKWKGESITLGAAFPVACEYRLIKNGEVIASGGGGRMIETIEGPGVYRVEGWLTVDGERRPWIYSNPIYVRE